jgi:hypothetical protein
MGGCSEVSAAVETKGDKKIGKIRKVEGAAGTDHLLGSILLILSDLLVFLSHLSFSPKI